MDSEGRPEIRVHLGAHKTASTHFERTLRRSRKASRAFFLARPVKTVVRERLTRRLKAVQEDPGLAGEIGGAALLRAFLPQDEGEAAGVTRIFVCDENVIGTTPDLFGGGRMYPRAAGQVRAMVALLGREGLACSLAIREPAGFVASAWGEAVRRGAFLDRHAYLAGTPLERMRWAPLVAGIRAALAGVPLTVWTFEDYPRLRDGLVRTLLDDGSGREPRIWNDDGPVREGPSARAIEEIRAACEDAGGPVGRERVEEIMRRFPKSPALPGPRLFDGREEAVLARLYLRDLEAIAALDGVTLLPCEAARAAAERRLAERA